jgi:prophage antirepressor-like protein
LVFYFGGKFMQNKLEIFKNEQFGEIRTVIIGGEPWFVLKDLCYALEIQNSRDVFARLDEDEKGVDIAI